MVSVEFNRLHKAQKAGSIAAKVKVYGKVGHPVKKNGVASQCVQVKMYLYES